MCLSLNNEKFNILLSEGSVPDCHLPSRGLEVDQRKKKIIKHLCTHKRQKYVRSFPRPVGYFRRFHKDFSKLAFPVFTFLSNNIELCWKTYCLKQFDYIKKNIIASPILEGPSVIYKIFTLPSVLLCVSLMSLFH